MTLSFTKRKFLKLTREQRHKKCAIVLRLIYEKLLAKKEPTTLYEEYQTYLEWLDEDGLTELNLKQISNHYHDHLKKAKINLKEHNLLTSLRTGDSKAKRPFEKNAIYLDNIRSAYNVGSILRTVESFRIGSVHFAKKTPFVDHPKVEKISMKTAKKVPTFKNSSIKDLPKPIIVVDTSDSAISLYDFIFPDNFTLVMGNEEYGTSDEILQTANYILEIPLFGMKNSINVASAFSIVASEWQRQILKKENINVKSIICS